MTTTHSTGTARQRRYTMPQTYRAIGHAMCRPNIQLVAPIVHPLPYTAAATALTPTAELLLPNGLLSALIEWATAMDVHSVVAQRLVLPAGQVRIRVTGSIGCGPVVVAVVDLDDNMPVHFDGHKVRTLTEDELIALADGFLSAGVDALVGAR